MKKPLSKKQNDKYLSPVRDQSGALKGYRFTPGPTLRAQGIKPQMLKMPNGTWMDHTTARIARDTILRTNAPIAIKPTPKAPNNYLTLKRAFSLYETYFNKKIIAGTRSKASLKAYSEHMKSWYDYFGDDANVKDIDCEIVQDAINLMSDEGIKPANLNARLATLKVLIKYIKQHIDRSVTKITDIEIEPPLKRLIIPNDQEISLLIETADNLAIETQNENFRYVGTAIIAAIWTAQRIGDLLKCDLGEQLFIEDDRQRLFFNQQKTNAQILIPILPPLAQRIGNRFEGKLIEKPIGVDWGYAYFRQHWAMVRDKAYENIINSKIIPKGIDKEKIKKLHFHDFRGAAITRLYSAGCTAIDIASWSGHSIQTITNMLKIYCQYQQKRADTAGDMLLDYFTQNNLRY